MNNNLRCISHEIRNQISVCELYSQIIKKHLDNQGIRNKSIEDALGCINKSLKLMSNSLTDLKSLDNFNPKRCELGDILRTAINLSIVYIQDKDINITLNCAEGCEVCIDEDKFESCVINIIKNGIEAIDKKGYINLEVLKKGDTINILISNNGQMIPIGTDIFKEGFTTKKSGSGLGLAICKENLALQNAELKLNKSTEKVTEFEIVIHT